MSTTPVIPRSTGQRSRFGALFAPVDIASLVVYRIGFGLTMAGWAIHYLMTGRVTSVYLAPKFQFTYYGLDFLRPWSGLGMQMQFGAIAFLALMVSAGLLYRFAAIALALCFTYVFLLERTNYQNHYYLLALLSWQLPLLPLNRAASLDVLNGSVLRSSSVPAWCLLLVRFQLALPYVFGGIAKINSDWLAGEPMRTHLARSEWRSVTGDVLTSEWTVALFSWGGMLFDLLIVPALLWKRTRIPAFIACIAFHLLNASLFNIHVFPWFMIVATPVFFDPSWPRLLLRLPSLRGVPASTTLSRNQKLGITLGVVYCTIQLALPLRHYLEPGETMWTERGHFFSWRMMLRGKSTALRFLLHDRESGETWLADVEAFVTPEQLSRLSRDPEMILHCAHQLADAYHARTGRGYAVHALVLCSLNGRKPQLMIDPNVNLAGEPRGFHARPWILPLTEPLRKEAWDVPPANWEQYVSIPPLKFLKHRRQQTEMTPRIDRRAREPLAAAQ